MKHLLIFAFLAFGCARPADEQESEPATPPEVSLFTETQTNLATLHLENGWVSASLHWLISPSFLTRRRPPRPTSGARIRPSWLKSNGSSPRVS
jgi:hypothetical protein